MAEENTVEEIKSEEYKYLEVSFRLFGFFRMRWGEIKELNDEE